jgi:hypothetical protein
MTTLQAEYFGKKSLEESQAQAKQYRAQRLGDKQARQAALASMTP